MTPAKAVPAAAVEATFAGAQLLDYGLLVLPGLALLGACFWLARGDRDPLLRIVVLILGFILIRDAMTPARLWEFGLVGGVVPWLRMTSDPVVLIAFGLGSLALVFLTLRDRALSGLVRWGRPNVSTIAMGVGGGLLAAAPVLALSAWHPIDGRGGAVALALLPALAFMAFAGNLGEEVFFRGYLQGRLERAMPAVRAAVLSGVLFAACHAFLATTVTDVGWPLLAFTLWEGLICAFLRMWRGVIPAAIAHGLAIFLLSSGLI
ncbi:CPBP family intramembrane glutamic endopeptidase [Agromyces silvae]|uniref:CPBP family intramembrane glutamic endopeptidase n=1 Tax=Agromyces silvae TaxID=3388266 RepID=UPI00280B021C|nr:type II CAAX endopeptidase family protein [Agromyces protaetiae]